MPRFLCFGVAVVALTVFSGCDVDETVASVVTCETARDCAQFGSGATCVRNVCALGDGTGTRDVGSGVDTGTSDTGGNQSDTGVVMLDTGVVNDTGSGGDTCVRACTGRECGPDGCGGTCGTCSGGETCSGGTCAGSTTLNCNEIIGCINECSDQTCYEGCIAQGSPTAQSQIGALLTCIDNNCTGLSGEEFQACQNDECRTELRTCQASSAGTDSCSEVVDCILPCADEACVQTCYRSGTLDAQESANAYLVCAVDFCEAETTIAGFYECAETNCPTEAATCASN
jgi:hypothetical protein